VLAADVGSKNGTLVNGKRIEGAELAHGDLLEAGSTLFHYVAALPTPADAPHDLASTELDGAPGLRTLLPELATKFADLCKVAPSPVPILLLGETGTGKELIARAVHELSRRPGTFVAINCGAIAPALLQSELFGHKKGAFSGAVSDRIGVLEASSGGTLFLDEIGEIPEHAQIALLRALQEREVTPLGASHPIALDLRIVAATHRDLAVLREDFIARLRGFTIELPPLARRVADLGVVIVTLLDRLAPGRPIRFDVDAARALVTHRWPRNIRELERTIETAIALANDQPIATQHLQFEALPAAAGKPDPRRAELLALLEEHGGNVSAVAAATGKKRQQIQKWLRKYGIDPDRFR